MVREQASQSLTQVRRILSDEMNKTTDNYLGRYSNLNLLGDGQQPVLSNRAVSESGRCLPIREPNILYSPFPIPHSPFPFTNTVSSQPQAGRARIPSQQLNRESQSNVHIFNLDLDLSLELR